MRIAKLRQSAKYSIRPLIIYHLAVSTKVSFEEASIKVDFIMMHHHDGGKEIMSKVV